MEATSPPSLARLAAFAANLSYDDIPAATVDLARCQLASVLASYATGFAASATRKVASGLGIEPATGLIPDGEGAPLLGALCAASMAHDFDDYLFMGHTGHSAVGTTLALARPGDDGREILTRVVIGNEIGGRLGASAFFGPHNGQLWTFIHLATAAAIHGRALGLDGAGIAHAMAIAFAQPPYPLPAGFMGSETKLLTAATPAMQGFHAARLAAAGVTGNLSLLEDPRGFWESFSFVPMRGFVSGLGRTWLTDTLTFKRYPGCAYLGTILDALRQLRESTPLRAEEVRSLDVEASFLTLEMDEMARPHREKRGQLDPVLINFSVADTVALDLLTGGLRCADLEPAALIARDAPVRELASRIRLHHAWDLSVELVRSINRSLPLDRLLGALTLKQLSEVRRQARRYHGKTMDMGMSALRRIVRELSGDEARALAFFLGGKALGKPKTVELDLADVSFVSFELPVAARVTVTLTSGRKLQATARRPEGSPQTPLRRDVPREKLVRDVGSLFGTEAAHEVLAHVTGLPASWAGLHTALRAPHAAMELHS